MLRTLLLLFLFHITTGCGVVPAPMLSSQVSSSSVPPRLHCTAMGHITVVEGESVTLKGHVTSNAAHPDFRYNWMQVAGAGVVFNSSSIESVEWTFTAPQVQQGDDFELRFRLNVDDGQAYCETEFVSVLVKAKQIRFDQIEERYALKEGKEFILPIRLTAPKDNHLLSLTVVGLPAGASFDEDAWVVHWTPSIKQGGRYEIQLKVNWDFAADGLAVERSIVLDVQEVNQAPKIDLGMEGTVTLDVGETLTFQAEVTDIDEGQNHTLSIEGMSANASFDVETGAFKWKTTLADAGEHFIAVKVVDDGSPARESIKTINVIVQQVR